MAEPPVKKFRFSSGSGRSGGGARRQSSDASQEARPQSLEPAARADDDNDAWGEELFLTEEFNREFDEICTQNQQLAPRVDFNRSRSNPHRRLSPTSSTAAAIATAASVSASAAALVGNDAGMRRSASNQPSAASASSQFVSFSRRSHAGSGAAPSAASAAVVGVAARTPSSTGRRRQAAAAATPAAAEDSLRDQMHTLLGEKERLADELEALQRELAKERSGRDVMEKKVKSLETDRLFDMRQMDNLRTENQSLIIRLRKREEQQQPLQPLQQQQQQLQQQQQQQQQQQRQQQRQSAAVGDQRQDGDAEPAFERHSLPALVSASLPEAAKLLPPVRDRILNFLLLLRCRKSFFDRLIVADNQDPGGICVDRTLAKRFKAGGRVPTARELLLVGLEGVQLLWQLVQLSGDCALALFHNVGGAETAFVADLFDLVRLLPYQCRRSVEEKLILHSALSILHCLLLGLDAARREQIVDFFLDLEPVERGALLRLKQKPTVTLYVKILLLVYTHRRGYDELATHGAGCRVAELAACVDCEQTSATLDWLELISAIASFLHLSVAMQSARADRGDGGVLLNRDCPLRCYRQVICAVSKTLAQFMPASFGFADAQPQAAPHWPVFSATVHYYIRVLDSLKDYLDVQSCRDIVRQDKTHYFIMGIVDSFKELAVTNCWQESEFHSGQQQQQQQLQQQQQQLPDE